MKLLRKYRTAASLALALMVLVCLHVAYATSSYNVDAQGAVSRGDIVEDLRAAIEETNELTVEVRVIDATYISAQTLEALDNVAMENGRESVLYADTVNAQGDGVQGRLFVKPHMLPGQDAGLQLGVYTEPAYTAEVKQYFDKWFNNIFVVVACDQEGSFGYRMHMAVMVDLTGLNRGSLTMYSFDRSTRSYTLLDDTDYYLDDHGFLHLNSELAGYIVITDAQLRPK